MESQCPYQCESRLAEEAQDLAARRGCSWCVSCMLSAEIAGLDVHSEQEMMEALEEYCGSCAGGVTRVMIAHQLSTVTNADQIAFIQDGKVMECGSHDV